LFLDDEVSRELAERGVAPLHATLLPAWHAHTGDVLGEATLAVPDIEASSHAAYRGGITGRHTEALGYLLAEMQHLQRSYPGTQW
jgi:ring-1,2-phenylacetyl-CoA epoxidase subunit PaaC